MEQVKTELLITLFTETQQYHHEQALGDTGKEKLPIKRQKPRTDPLALGGWSSVSTSWGERERDKERERERGTKRERETNRCSHKHFKKQGSLRIPKAPKHLT